jgi:DNA-directed RNA polymerase specialized sigma24 family protein
MAKMDEDDELHTRKGLRRRGRKNKYYNQIDLEDDQEIDPDEVSDKDADLQIIKEQEEEEEALRKMVAASSKKQQEVTAARISKLDQEKLTREQRAEREAGELKLKQQQEA